VCSRKWNTLTRRVHFFKSTCAVHRAFPNSHVVLAAFMNGAISSWSVFLFIVGAWLRPFFRSCTDDLIRLGNSKSLYIKKIQLVKALKDISALSWGMSIVKSN
jgi:hypothetical protein